MTDQRKKEIADHYMEAINREDLHTSQAGRFLNLNPCYLSMVKNQKHWPSMSQAAWDRLEEWHESRCKISEFIIPEGEPIFKKPERKPSLPEEGDLVNAKKRKIPSPPTPPEARKIKHTSRKKEARQPGIKLSSDTSEGSIKLLETKVAEVTLKTTLLLKEIAEQDEAIKCLKYGMEIQAGLIQKLREYIDAVNENLSKKVDVKIKGEDLRKIVFFQRNYYK